MNDCPDVAVIVSSHCRPISISKVLFSICNQKNVKFELIVIDNKSAKSDDIAAVIANFYNVKLIRLDENIGFGRAINRGISVTSAPYLYFACDDVLLEDSCLHYMLEFMKNCKTAGIISPIMFTNNPPYEVRYAGAKYIFSFYSKLVISTVIPSSTFDLPYKTDFIPGGMLMIRRELIENLGGYREDFYMYSEDVDLSLRVRKAGWDLYVAPKAKVFDLDPPPTYNREMINAYKIRNNLAIFVLHAPISLLPIILCRELISGLIRIICSVPNQRLVFCQGWWKFLLFLPKLFQDRILFYKLARKIKKI